MECKRCGCELTTTYERFIGLCQGCMDDFIGCTNDDSEQEDTE